jgi:hypothetical protein
MVRTKPLPAAGNVAIFTLIVAMLLVAVGCAPRAAPAVEPVAAEPSAEPTKLAVVWSSGDPMVAHRVCLMYTHAAKTRGWFDEVLLVVWGPSAELLSRDEPLQTKVRQMMDAGVRAEACITCAREYGVVEHLESLGITVHGMGQPLSRMLQSDEWRVITF